MAFGSPEWRPWILPSDKGVALLKAAWDAGINTIDTANMYSNGESERIIGQFMTRHAIPRDQIDILTKVFCRVDPANPGSRVAFDPSAAQTKQYANDAGLSRLALIKHVDASLERLKMSYIDLLLIHAWDGDSIPVEETMRTLDELVRSGKVRYIGASNVKAWQIAEMNGLAERRGWTTFTSVQVEHSLLYRSEELEMFEYCRYKGIAVLAYAPLMDGHLARPLPPSDTPTTDTKTTNKPSKTPLPKTTRATVVAGTPLEKKRRDSDKAIIRRVEELAGKKGVMMSQIALAWSGGKVTAPIVGANSPERVQQAIVDVDLLTPEEIRYLEERYEDQPSRA